MRFTFIPLLLILTSQLGCAPANSPTSPSQHRSTFRLDLTPSERTELAEAGLPPAELKRLENYVIQVDKLSYDLSDVLKIYRQNPTYKQAKQLKSRIELVWQEYMKTPVPQIFLPSHLLMHRGLNRMRIGVKRIAISDSDHEGKIHFYAGARDAAFGIIKMAKICKHIEKSNPPKWDNLRKTQSK